MTTDGTRGIGAAALRRVLDDLHATYGDATDSVVCPRTVPLGDREETVWFAGPGGTGSAFGMHLYPDDAEQYAAEPGDLGTASEAGDLAHVPPVGERVAVMIADQFQDEVVESLPATGRPAVWPECPRHPGSHPLGADLREGGAVWCCPRDGVAIAPIGELRPRTNVS